MRLNHVGSLLRAGRLVLSALLGGALLIMPNRMSAQAHDSLMVRAWGGNDGDQAAKSNAITNASDGVDPFHWSNRAVQALRGNNVIPLYEDRYINLRKREQYAVEVQRGIDYSIFGKPGPDGAHFPVDDPQRFGPNRHDMRKTLWPEEARLMLRLLREYRPDVGALWKRLNRDPSELAVAEQRLIALSRDPAPLETPLPTLHMEHMMVGDVYTSLVDHYHVALSLIETAADTRVSIDVQAGTVRDVLNQITAQAPAYRLKTLAGRLILMPSEACFEAIVTEPTFKNVPRLEAQRRYCDYLSKNVPGFAELGGPIFIMGDPHAPIFSDPITLHGKTTVLERFMQLLGDNPRACFYLYRRLKPVRDDMILSYIKNLRADSSLLYINLVPRAVEESNL